MWLLHICLLKAFCLFINATPDPLDIITVALVKNKKKPCIFYYVWVSFGPAGGYIAKICSPRKNNKN